MPRRINNSRMYVGKGKIAKSNHFEKEEKQLQKLLKENKTSYSKSKIKSHQGTIGSSTKVT